MPVKEPKEDLRPPHLRMPETEYTIMPVENYSWHSKSGDEHLRDITRDKVYQAFWDPRTSTYATGLSDEEEEAMGRFLNSDLSKYASPTEEHPFYSHRNAQLRLPNQALILNSRNPYDFIKIKVALASRFVANSKEALINGEFPDATHYMYSEARDFEIKDEEITRKTEAYSIAGQMSDSKLRTALQVFFNKPIPANLAPGNLKIQMENAIKEDTTRFLSVLKIESSDLEVRALIVDALAKNVISKHEKKYFYINDLIGTSLENAIAFLSDPENQETRIAIKQKLIT